MEKINPCPFCGSTHLRIIKFDFYERPTKQSLNQVVETIEMVHFRVTCESCGAIGPNHCDHISKENSVYAWNRGSQLSQQEIDSLNRHIHDIEEQNERMLEQWTEAQEEKASKQKIIDCLLERTDSCRIKSVAMLANSIANKKGWHQNPRTSISELVSNLHSEVSELWEAYREKNPQSEKIPEHSKIEEEAADIILRVLDAAHEMNWKIESALLKKCEYNSNRPYRHGGKLA